MIHPHAVLSIYHVAQMLAMVNLSGNKMAPFPGGVCIKSAETGKVIGAVGVSGANSDEDEYCALVGIVEAEIPGCTTEPAQHSLKECDITP